MHVEPAPEALADARALLAQIRERELRLAVRLAEIDGKKAYAIEGSASIGEWTSDNGGDARRGVELCTLGKGFAKEPRLETEVKSGALEMVRACAAARVITFPKAVHEGEDWVEKAKKGRLRDFLHDVKLRLEETRGDNGPMGMVHIPATEETKHNWRRCRDVLALILKHSASDGETFKWAIEATLDAHDPLRQKAGKRRVGPTDERPEDRYVPSEVVRDLLRRGDLLCEVPGCDRPATEKAHVRPHEMGSGREKRDLFGACHDHHVLYDSGYLRITGWTADGKPIFAKGKAPPHSRRGGNGPPRHAKPRGAATKQAPRGEMKPDDTG